MSQFQHPAERIHNIFASMLDSLDGTIGFVERCQQALETDDLDTITQVRDQLLGAAAAE